jgi:hypothetical protein
MTATDIDKLFAEQRAFLKPLRHEAKHAGKFPNFLLLDAGARPVALDILSPFLTGQECAAKVEAIATRELTGWQWDTARTVVIPGLPPQGRRAVAPRLRAALRHDRALIRSNASPDDCVVGHPRPRAQQPGLRGRRKDFGALQSVICRVTLGYDPKLQEQEA